MDAVSQWLEGLGLEKYAPVFLENEIDMDVLVSLTEDDLRELALPLGPRKKVLKALEALSGGEVAVFRSVGAERRQLSVVFCDLMESTDMVVRLDPEEMRRVLASFHACCREAIEAHGGRISQYLGDGVLAFFGYPTANEDDAERAVRAALEIAEKTSSLSPSPDLPMRMRAGVDTGDVVVGVDQSGAPMAVGDTMNFAARLQSLAGENAVVVSSRTHQLAAKAFEFADLGEKDVKGFGAQRIWRAAPRARSGDPLEAAQMDRTALIGRDEELATLRSAWADAKSGAPRFLFISGDAGIGKSRLLRQFRAEAARDDPERVTIYGGAQFSRSAYYPLIGWLRGRFSLPLGAAEDALNTRIGEELSEIGVDEAHVSAIAAVLLADELRFRLVR